MGQEFVFVGLSTNSGDGDDPVNHATHPQSAGERLSAG